MFIEAGQSSTISDKSGKCLTKEQEILSRWTLPTEYCSELITTITLCYGANTVLDCSQHPEEDLRRSKPILHDEAEITVAALKMGTSAGVDNILVELVQIDRETMFDVLTKICNKKTKE